MRSAVLLIAIALAFCLTELTLNYYLPFAKTDYDVWLRYFIVKDAVYDTMFFVFSLVLFWSLDKKLSKSISAFLLIVTGGSFIDKVIFGINQYLASDILLIVLGIIMGLYTYIKYGRRENVVN